MNTNMIDAIVKITDRLIQLLVVGETRRGKYFKDFVEPMYADAEAIIGDYIDLFRELISRLQRNEEVSEVIK